MGWIIHLFRQQNAATFETNLFALSSLEQLNCQQMARVTILEYLDNFRRFAREVAYVHHRGYRMQRWTYGDVLSNAYRFACELEQRGIGKGDKVLIWGENCAEWVVAFFGCVLRGAIVVPIDKIAATDFAQRVAQQVDATLCVASMQNHISGVPEINLESSTRADCRAIRSARRSAAGYAK